MTEHDIDGMAEAFKEALRVDNEALGSEIAINFAAAALKTLVRIAGALEQLK